MSAPEMAGTFRKAAEVIRTGGLVQHAYEYGSRHCTAGAVMVAKGVDMLNVEGVRPEVRYLTELLGGSDEQFDPVFAVARWNDAKSRTADDVITLLEQAAEKLEADQ